MKINSVNNSINFKALILEPQAIQYIDRQSDDVKRRFLLMDRSLSNTKYWDVEFKNNKFYILGKKSLQGIVLNEKFSTQMLGNDVFVNTDGRFYYDIDDNGKFIKFDNLKLEVPSDKNNYVDYVNDLPRIEKVMEITRNLETQGNKVLYTTI